MKDVSALVSSHTLISDQIETNELRVILDSLNRILGQNIPGEVVEFGCYVGTTSLFLQRLLQGENRQLHVYDSFAGLPEKTKLDQSPAGMQFRSGELTARKSDFILNFKKANLPLPIIHKSWFDDLTPSDVPDQIAFAFLDGDYYESVLTPLKLIWPKLSPSAVIIVDDYQNEALPGASKAVDEWLHTHPVAKFSVQASLAVMVLPAS